LHTYIEYIILTILFKLHIYYGEEPALYYWCTSSGSDVDLVIETQDQLVPVEIKQSETPRPEMAKEIVNFQKDCKGKVVKGYIIHPGQKTLPLGTGVMALPLSNL
jgi:predicted AAA+ superfamily ATPase